MKIVNTIKVVKTGSEVEGEKDLYGRQGLQRKKKETEEKKEKKKKTIVHTSRPS